MPLTVASACPSSSDFLLAEVPPIDGIRWIGGGGFTNNSVNVTDGVVTLYSAANEGGSVLGSWDTSTSQYDTLGEVSDAINSATTVMGASQVDGDVSPNAPSSLLINQSVNWGGFGGPPLLIDAS